MVDFLVVGGGSAGCVLAARLSEHADCEVLLLEGGPDATAVDDLPRDVIDASQPTEGHDWGYLSEPDILGRSIALPRARFMGGCSSTNGCFAIRGARSDYDGWAERGNPGWSFDDVLPYFRQLETDADFPDEWHGTDGPLPIRRHPPSERNAVQSAFIEAATASGFAYVEDHNRPDVLGAGPTPRNARDGVRMSTALTYLAAARSRPNLQVRADAVVDRIILCNGQARGVCLVGGEIVEADRVVLAAGAYASPIILQRSGIGPATLLRSLGVDVNIDLPGVGENLVDHPLCAVDLPTHAEASGPRFQTVASLRSRTAAMGGAPDLHVFPPGRSTCPPRSVRPDGSSGLSSAFCFPTHAARCDFDLPTQPTCRIDVAHLRDGDDMERMVEGTLVARRISRTTPLAEVVSGDELSPGPSVADEDLDGLAASIRSRVSTYHHPVGSCRMGPDGDTDAVVNPRGKVYGVDALYVADASVMPTIPSANTNLPTIMVAERIAAWLTEG